MATQTGELKEKFGSGTLQRYEQVVGIPSDRGLGTEGAANSSRPKTAQGGDRGLSASHMLGTVALEGWGGGEASSHGHSRAGVLGWQIH